MNYKERLSKIEVDDDFNPVEGLGDTLFDTVSCLTPMVNVDLLIYNTEGKMLVSWREDAVCGKGWHIPGGIIRFKEHMKDRIEKTALEELGCIVDFDPVPLEINEIILDQTIRGHFISLLYQCYLPDNVEIKTDALKKYTAGALHWYDVDDDEPLVKGQADIYTKYARKIKDEKN